MKVTLLNEQIYEIAAKIQQYFTDHNLVLPARVNYNFHLNSKIFIAIAQDLEQKRQIIIEQYGELDNIQPDKIDEINDKIHELLSETNEIDIYPINITDLKEDINLTIGQMEVLMFFMPQVD